MCGRDWSSDVCSSDLMWMYYVINVLSPIRRGELNPGVLLMCGGLTGIANWVVAIVPDTLKSRLQTGSCCYHS